MAGPQFFINGPTPTPPPFSLLRTVEVLAESDPHWQNGISLYPYPADLPSGQSACGVGTYRAKDAGESVPLPDFDPIVVYLPENCFPPSIGGYPGDQEKYQARAEAVLNAVASFAVERQLVTGEHEPANPYLGDSNRTLLNNGVTTDGQAGLALLEDAVGRTGRQGLIHATPSIVSAWDSAGYTLVESGGVLRTRRGTPIVVGDGYIDMAPDGQALDDTEQFAWATGPVLILKSPIYQTPETVREALDRENNLVTYRSEQNFVVAWDTVLQAAVKIDWSA